MPFLIVSIFTLVIAVSVGPTQADVGEKGALAPLPASSEGDLFSFPVTIDLDAKNKELKAAFPERESALPKRDALAKYGSALEIFRVASLEQLNFDILSICENLKIYERYIYSLSREKIIGPQRLRLEERRIQDERNRCSVDKAASSPYFQLYYRYFNLYKSEAAAVRAEKSACESSISCRSGE